MCDQEDRNDDARGETKPSCTTCRHRIFLMGMMDACCGNRKSDHFGRFLGDRPMGCDKHERPE